MKIVVLDGYNVNHDGLFWEVRERFSDLVWYDETPAGEIAARIEGADALFVNRAPLTREHFEAAKNLRYVGVLGTGYNAVDTAAAKEHGVVVTNVAGYSTDSVTQVVFSLILEIMGSIQPRTDYVREGGWAKFADPKISKAPMNELAGKTLGIIGLGTIGLAVAKVAAAFGMSVIAHRRSPDPSLEGEHLRFATLDELFAQSDIISLHCPLSDATKGLINRGTIAKMKDGAVIINTARGPIIDEQDVAEALNSGKLFMVGLDVLSQEPPQPGHPLVGHPRAVITPHIGWTAKEARERLLALSAQNFFAFLDDSPINVVNP